MLYKKYHKTFVKQFSKENCTFRFRYDDNSILRVITRGISIERGKFKRNFFFNHNYAIELPGRPYIKIGGEWILIYPNGKLEKRIELIDDNLMLSIDEIVVETL